MNYDTSGKVLRKPVFWKNLFSYRKSDTLYQLTVVFCQRFLPPYGDRTVDQMVQAARSGKQNIVEGSEDGRTSSEMELKLLNVARSSLMELREDYKDYLNRHSLPLWDSSNSRYVRLLAFCQKHNDFGDYAPLVKSMNDEEMANLAITLCHQTDKMLSNYIAGLEKRFVLEGGIKERMHAARTGYRLSVDSRLSELEIENTRLKSELANLQSQNQVLQSENQSLQARIQSLQSENQTLQARIQALQSEKQTLQARIQTL